MKPTPFDEALEALDLSPGELEPIARIPAAFEARRRSAGDDESSSGLSFGSNSTEEQESFRFPLQRLSLKESRFLQLRQTVLERWACALFADEDDDGAFAVESLSAPIRTHGGVQALDRGLWRLDPGPLAAGALFERCVVLVSRFEVFIGKRSAGSEPAERAAQARTDAGPGRSALKHGGRKDSSATADVLFAPQAQSSALDAPLSQRASKGPSRKSFIAEWLPSSGPDSRASLELQGLLEDRPAAPWLVGLTRSQAREARPYAQAVAAGLFGRLWVPPAAEDPLRDPGPAEQAPSAQLQRWYERSGEPLRQPAEAEALQTTDALQRTLPELAALATSRIRGRLQHAVQRWVTVRDDLESVAHLLGPERSRSELGWALERLDREASVYLSTFAEVELDDDPRLRSVSWQEPDAWWGQLAVPLRER